MKRFLIALTIFTACKKEKKQEPVVATPPPPAADAAIAPPDAPAVAGFDPGELSTPESVLYDEGRDMYIVSNIHGEPAATDDNGYLVVVNPDGSNERSNANFRWVDGAAQDIKLDAPKGMAIAGDILYVADITVVRRFEAKSGKQLDDIKIEGSMFLNDITPDGNGGVFVSDTGVGSDFKPAGTDAIYQISKDGKLSTRIKNKDLGNPNGIWSDGKGSVWVVTFGSGEIYEVDAKGVKGKPQKLPAGQLDGIVGLDGGDFAVTSWECKCVYRGKPGAEWTPVMKDIEAPADLGYDPKRKRLVVPSFTTNKVHVHQL